MSAESNDSAALPPSRRKPRLWRDKFREAFRGVKRGVRGHSSFSVHFFFAVLAVLLCILLECDRVEWCLVIGCIGIVIAAELFNSAIETMFRGLEGEARDRVYSCLDIAAGAVLIAGLTSAVIGSIIFGHRLLHLLKGQ